MWLNKFIRLILVLSNGSVSTLLKLALNYTKTFDYDEKSVYTYTVCCIDWYHPKNSMNKKIPMSDQNGFKL